MSRTCTAVSRPCGLSSSPSSSSVVVSSLQSIPLSPLPLSPAVFFPFIGVPPSLSLFLSSHTGLLRPLLLLVFREASAFNQDLSSWNVGKVTTMNSSESSVRSLLLLLVLLVGRGVLSFVYTSLSSPSLSCGVLPLLVSPPSLSSSPLTLVSSAPSSSITSVPRCLQLLPDALRASLGGRHCSGRASAGHVQWHWC